MEGTSTILGFFADLKMLEFYNGFCFQDLNFGLFANVDFISKVLLT